MHMHMHMSHVHAHVLVIMLLLLCCCRYWPARGGVQCIAMHDVMHGAMH